MNRSAHQPDWLEEIEHTADAGFRVRARDLPELFERAAVGLFSVICDLGRVVPKQTAEVRVQASDLPALLVRWLAELNFQHLTRRQLFTEFHVDEIEKTRLKARVCGEEINLARHEIFTEVKAVTFHGLKIERTNGYWQAEVILDL